MEKRILRLLIVDDSPDDTELAVAAIRKGGFMIKSQRVQDLAGMQAALEKSQWDLVLSEHALPHFGAQMAHDLLRRAGLDIPFILFTRAINDADLVAIMQAGARDVIRKGEPVRLVPVVNRELAWAEMQRAYKAATAKLQETEDKHRAVVEGSREAIAYVQDGMHVNVNKAYLTAFGYNDPAELDGIPVMNLIDKSDQPRFKELLKKQAREGSAMEPQEFVGVKQDGTRIPVEFAVSSVVLQGEPAIQIVATDISRRKAVESKLEYLGQHDPLTGAFNRHRFLQELGKAVELARRGEGSSAIFFMDLNQLKELNDALGYATGDRILIRVAKLIREHLGDGAVVARLAGHEFAALVYDQSVAQLEAMHDALGKALKEAAFSEAGKTFHCHCAMSVTPIDKAVESANHVLSHAYQASQKVRAAMAPATAAKPAAPAAATTPPPTPAAAKDAAEPPPAPAPETPAPAATPAMVGWKERIQTALQKNEFTLAYQPIINLHGDAAEFFEVLVRMNGRNGELIPAGEFMPAAEQSGLAAAVDRWVVRHAIEALSALHREGREASFFINLCPSALRDKELPPLIGQVLFATGVKHRFVVFEMDEAGLNASTAAATTFIKAIGQIGCQFSVDNFGKRHGPIEYLRGLPVQFLKIDGAIVRALASDTVNQASLKAIVEVAHTLNMKTVAKCVEKAENLAMLWNYGLDYVQGHYFQEADAALQFEHAGETTIASDVPQAPSWVSR